MTNYTAGRSLEYRVIADLERDGYVCVRAAGSKGAADIVALKPGQVLLVQAKRSGGTIPPLERATLLAKAAAINLPGRMEALPIVAHPTKPRGPLTYRLLTGQGPADWTAWTADEVTA